ncbi:MAG: RimK family alpha-L-glutamate ligase [Lachnospiraceae bacterium]|nr:RimK family alpha-L-glutamate ligase [Lachnospiraceae bacterium]
MRGWLIVNKFLYNEKFGEIYNWLITAAKKAGSELTLLTNADFLIRTDLNMPFNIFKHLSKPDYVIFWDKDIRLARALEACGLRLYNCADAIEACDDKSLTFSKLAGHVKLPITFNVPFTYTHLGYNNTDFLDDIEKELRYPYVLKECFGSFGAQVHLIRSKNHCKEILKTIQGRPCLIQEYIPTPGTDPDSFSGRDIRINVVGNKCITSMLRYNDNDFRANITNGGNMEKYTPDDKECELALKVCSLLKLDYAGVDILFGSNNEPVLCEVNSNAHFKNIYDCTHINVADAMITYILNTCHTS